MTPRRARCSPSYCGCELDPRRNPPPWIQTMTGSLSFALLAAVQMFSVRQSSLIGADGSRRTEASCMQTGPNRAVSRMPCHRAARAGGLQRSSPTGGAAYGMPLKLFTSVPAPATRPDCVRTGMSIAGNPKQSNIASTRAQRVQRKRGSTIKSEMVTRRTLLGGIASTAVSKAQRVTRRKPNFLFILADDHAGYVLGADGNRLARTPNLDRLASESVRFSRHYCNAPVCTPSRQSFFTGQLPHMAGVTRLPTPLSEEKPTLAKQFQKAGYTTAVFGKMHFIRPGVPGMHGLDIVHTEDVLTREWQQQVKPKPIPENIRTKPLPWKPLKDPARIWLNADDLPYPCYDADMRACFQVRQAEQFLEQYRDKPFALWVSFLEPHSPFDFPVDYAQKYSPAQFSVPPVGPEDGWQIPLIFRDLSPADKQGINAAYYTSVEFLDRNIGLVLKKLADLNLDRDTCVVYMADHGYDLGQHGRFEKHCGYDPALRVPLLMRYPGRFRPAVVTDMTAHIDVPATIVDVMELERLPIQHGHTLRPYLEGKRAAPREHIFSEYLENEEAYIRTGRWKFIYCTGKRARKDGYITDNPTPGRYTILYDLESDPGEFHNVVQHNPDLAGKFTEMLLKTFRTTH